MLLDDQPIRASAEDACYLVQYIDHLRNLVTTGSLDLGAEHDEALAAYAEARAEFMTRFTEAGGVACPE